MKEYIRTTHNFNNKTREWEYRGDKDGDEHGQWCKDVSFPDTKWILNLHFLSKYHWTYLRTIIDNAISYYENVKFVEFEALKKENPNYRRMLKNEILKQLEVLINLDMVRVRENKVEDSEFWNS